MNNYTLFLTVIIISNLIAAYDDEQWPFFEKQGGYVSEVKHNSSSEGHQSKDRLIFN